MDRSGAHNGQQWPTAAGYRAIVRERWEPPGPFCFPSFGRFSFRYNTKLAHTVPPPLGPGGTVSPLRGQRCASCLQNPQLLPSGARPDQAECLVPSPQQKLFQTCSRPRPLPVSESQPPARSRSGGAVFRRIIQSWCRSWLCETRIGLLMLSRASLFPFFCPVRSEIGIQFVKQKFIRADPGLPYNTGHLGFTTISPPPARTGASDTVVQT
jgi:hypothetical protein